MAMDPSVGATHIQSIVKALNSISKDFSAVQREDLPAFATLLNVQSNPLDSEGTKQIASEWKQVSHQKYSTVHKELCEAIGTFAGKITIMTKDADHFAYYKEQCRSNPQLRNAISQFSGMGNPGPVRPRPQAPATPATPAYAPRATEPAATQQPASSSKTGLVIAIVALAVVALVIFFSLGSNDKGATRNEDWSVEQNESKVYEEQDNVVETEEAVAERIGYFSVSDYTRVRIASGNLQYNPSSGMWRFAPHQYDIVGNANRNISNSYSGWIDLFAWGTGDNPTNASKDAGDFYYFNDWGSYIGMSGWRTPTISEWNYLFNYRSGASSKRGSAIINGVAGIILLPDNWEQPSGISFNTSVWTKDYSTNVYSLSQWNRMEAAGAVFLPAAGRRDGRDMFHVGTDGDYWSSTPEREGRAYNIDFVDAAVNAYDNSKTKQAFAVRLIREQ